MSTSPHAVPTTRPHPRRRLGRQRGTSVIGLLMIAIIVGFVALMAIRVYPSVTEYLTIKRAVTQIMKGNPATPADVRTAFEKQKEVEYNISTLEAKDLDIQQNGDRMTTRFAYNVEVPIVEPVYLMIKYSGSASSGGSGP
jgi:hypothetical protein